MAFRYVLRVTGVWLSALAAPAALSGCWEDGVDLPRFSRVRKANPLLFLYLDTVK